MSAAPWIAAGVGAALVGGAVYLRRRKEADAPSGPPVDNCEKLRVIGGQQAVDACKAIKAGFAVVDAIVPDFADTANVKLNGPAVERVPVAVMAVRRLEANQQHGAVAPLQLDYTTKYQNGCVPVPGHPGWSKCAPGTKSMIEDQWFSSAGSAAGFSPSSVLSGDFRRAGGAGGRDPLTFTWPPDRPWPGPPGGTPYVSPENPGTRFVYKGQPMICPAGTQIASGTDHRAIQGPPCVAARGDVPPPPTAPVRSTTTPVRTSSSGGRTADYRSDPPR